MYRAQKIETTDKALFYKVVNHLLETLIQDEPDWMASLANASALLGHQLIDINWVGFYIMRNGELVLGPFQGRPACTHIPVGSGVCGTAARNRKALLIADVHQFPGHIACDAATASEIVVPIIDGQGNLLAVLDIDSPVLGRFGQADAVGLEMFTTKLACIAGWPI